MNTCVIVPVARPYVSAAKVSYTLFSVFVPDEMTDTTVAVMSSAAQKLLHCAIHSADPVAFGQATKPDVTLPLLMCTVLTTVLLCCTVTFADSAALDDVEESKIDSAALVGRGSVVLLPVATGIEAGVGVGANAEAALESSSVTLLLPSNSLLRAVVSSTVLLVLVLEMPRPAAM